MGKARKSSKKNYSKKHRRGELPAEDRGLCRDRSNSLPGSNQENAPWVKNSSHDTQNVEEIVKSQAESHSVILQTSKRTARKSVRGLKTTGEENIAENNVMASHASEHSLANCESLQTCAGEKPSAEDKDLSEDVRASSLVNMQESEASVGEITKQQAASQPAVLQIAKKTARKSVRGLKTTDQKTVADSIVMANHASEHSRSNRKSLQTRTGKNPSAEDKDLSEDESDSSPINNQENVASVSEIAQMRAGSQGKILERTKKTARKSVRGLKTTDRTIVADSKMMASEHSHDNCESLQACTGEKPSAEDKDLSEDENDSSPINNHGSVVSVSEIIQMRAGSQAKILERTKKTARKSVRGLETTDRTIVADNKMMASEHSHNFESLQACTGEKPSAGDENDSSPINNQESVASVSEITQMRAGSQPGFLGRSKKTARKSVRGLKTTDRTFVADSKMMASEHSHDNCESLQACTGEKQSAEDKDLPEGDSDNSPINMQENEASLGEITKKQAASQPAILQIAKKTARKSARGLKTIDRTTVADSNMMSGEHSHDNCENLLACTGEKPSAEDKVLSETESDSSPINNLESIASTENSIHNTQNLAEVKKKLIGRRSVGSRVTKKTTHKPVRELQKNSQKSIVSDAVNEEHHHRDNCCDDIENVKVMHTDKSSIEDKNNSALESSEDFEQFLRLSPSQKTRGRLLMISEEQLNKEFSDMEAEMDRIHGDLAEGSSEEDNNFYSTVENIIADTNLFGEEDGDNDELTERSVGSDNSRQRAQSESPLTNKLVPRQKRTVATRPSRIDMHQQNVPLSRKRGSERGNNHDNDDDSDIMVSIPKRSRGRKLRDSSSSSSNESAKTKSEASRIKAAFTKQLKNCSVVVEMFFPRAPATPRRGRGRPQKIGTSDVANPLGKARVAPKRGRGRTRKDEKAVQSRSSEDESSPYNRLEVSLHDDSDSSCIVKTVRKKSAVPVQHRKASHMRKCAAAARKLFQSAEHTDEHSDENDEQENDVSERENEYTHSSQSNENGALSRDVRFDLHSASYQCFVNLRRLPIDGKSKSILLTTAFLKDLSPDPRVQKKVDEDWEYDESSSSTSSSSDSSSSSSSSEDLTFSSGSDVNYEPSESDPDVHEVKMASSSSGSDLDYEVSSSEEEIRFSKRIHSKVKTKLRKRARMQGTVKLSESESSQSSSDDDSASSDKNRSDDNANKKDDELSHDSENTMETDSAPVARDLSHSDDDDRSDHSDLENTEPDSRPVVKDLSVSDDDMSIHDVLKKAKPADVTPKRGKGRPRKDELDNSSSLNNSDVENMDSGLSMPPRKKNQKRSFGAKNFASFAYDDDALRSIFNIYPCQVVCRRMTLSSSNVHYPGT